MSRPLISVVTPVRNCQAYLGEAIESVLAQSYAPVEMIVVDDDSDDDTAQVARSYRGAVRYLRQSRAGAGAARNLGVEAANGPFLAFLDADDRFVADKLDLQMEEFRRDESLDVVFGHVREFLSPELGPNAAARVQAPRPEPMPFPSPTLALIRRQSFDRVGPFTTDLPVGDVVDWYARARDIGLRMRMIPDVVLERRLHTRNTGITAQTSRVSYARLLRASLERRREQQSPAEPGLGGT